jgi:sulfate adenylyltransferase subunit 1
MFDSYDHNRSTGAFILIDPMSNYTSAVGMIVGEDAPSCELSQRAVSLAEMGFVGEARSVVERFCKELRLRYGIDIELRG